MISDNSAAALPNLDVWRSSSLRAAWVLARRRKMRPRIERRISMRSSASCSAKNWRRTDWMRAKHGRDMGVL